MQRRRVDDVHDPVAGAVEAADGDSTHHDGGDEQGDEYRHARGNDPAERPPAGRVLDDDPAESGARTVGVARLAMADEPGGASGCPAGQTARLRLDRIGRHGPAGGAQLTTRTARSSSRSPPLSSRAWLMRPSASCSPASPARSPAGSWARSFSISRMSPSLPRRSGPAPTLPSTRPSVYITTDQLWPSSTRALGHSAALVMPGGRPIGACSSLTASGVTSIGCGCPARYRRPSARSG